MLRKSILGLVAMAGLVGASAGTASAHHRCHPNYGYGYRPYGPRVILQPAPVYPYAQTYGYNYNYVQPGYVQPGYVQPGYVQPGYVQPGLGVTTPGWGFYVR